MQAQIVTNNLSPDRVLLVCIKTKAQLDIAPDNIYQVFSKLGKILKILIFEKNVTTKAFVEYELATDASKAKILLHNTNLITGFFSKMNIFFSKLPSISFGSNFASGKDYSLEETSPKSHFNVNGNTLINDISLNEAPLSNHQTNSIACIHDNNTEETKNINLEKLKEDDGIDLQNLYIASSHNDKIDEKIDVFSDEEESYFFRVKKAYTRPLDESFKKFDEIKQARISNPSLCNSKEHSPVREVRQTKTSITNSLQALVNQIRNEKIDSVDSPQSINSHASQSYYQDLPRSISNQIGKNNHTFKPSLLHQEVSPDNPPSFGNEDLKKFKYILENKQSAVLYVKGFENPNINLNMIYNLFSNFGNILRIIFMKNKQAALVEFSNIEYAVIAKDYLNNILFLNSPLRIFYSNYNMISMKTKIDENNDHTQFGTHFNLRFKLTNSISINPPAKTLHLSNLVKEACTEEVIRSVFERYGKIEAIKFLIHEKSKNMCLLKYVHLEEALIAMAYLHDSNIKGRKIQISFTRSKIQGRG